MSFTGKLGASIRSKVRVISATRTNADRASSNRTFFCPARTIISYWSFVVVPKHRWTTGFRTPRREPGPPMSMTTSLSSVPSLHGAHLSLCAGCLSKRILVYDMPEYKHDLHAFEILASQHNRCDVAPDAARRTITPKSAAAIAQTVRNRADALTQTQVFQTDTTRRLACAWRVLGVAPPPLADALREPARAAKALS